MRLGPPLCTIPWGKIQVELFVIGAWWNTTWFVTGAPQHCTTQQSCMEGRKLALFVIVIYAGMTLFLGLFMTVSVSFFLEKLLVTTFFSLRIYFFTHI